MPKIGTFSPFIVPLESTSKETAVFYTNTISWLGECSMGIPSTWSGSK